MAENKLYNTFEKDTRNFINQINDSLIKLENDGYSVDLINHIFRCIHSIKSEASYLNFEEITAAAHDMESVIEPLRNVGTDVEVDPALIEYCFTTIDKIGTLSNDPSLLNEEAAELVELDEAGEEDNEDFFDLSTETESDKPYTEFELMLLGEAIARGESLYRLSFCIADDEAMKYPRAYLAISNLEQEFNVIKITPAPEDLDESDENRIEIILTTGKTEEQVAERINIDQIVDVELQILSFSEELENKMSSVKNADDKILERSISDPDKVIPARERTVSVEAEEIDAISNYVSEIKKRLTDLSSAVSGGGSEDKLEYDLAGLELISESIEGMMANLQTVDFNKNFAGFKRTVCDIASQLNKRAELDFDDENIRIQRDFAEFISEPLLQIIRNAVVHGIEEPGGRGDKAEIGSISVKTILEDGRMIIIIKDDGKGIDMSSLPEKYGNITNDEQLLELLVQPGYTTLSESKQFGGRGVGLDLVVNRIKTRGGRLELKNIFGTGCEFRIVFENFQ